MVYKFQDSFYVKYSDCDYRGCLTPGRLLEYLQETAMHHGDALGYPISRLLADDLGFVITDFRVRFDKELMAKDHFSIITWYSKVMKMQLVRSYKIISDATGAIIGEGVSRFAFVDLKKRRPTPFKPWMAVPEVKSLPHSMSEEKFIVPKPNENELYSERTFKVLRSELDSSMHVNNTKYLIWAYDDVSDEIFDDMRLFEIRVTYRKECRCGMDITGKIYLPPNESENEKTVVACYYQEDGKLSAQVNMLWKKRETQKDTF
ncbi:MAG: hypothetical protein IJC39_01440 [Firmicutes bacterium]|nr:hypothetical protein [Bacillota bacterium]